MIKALANGASEPSSNLGGGLQKLKEIRIRIEYIIYALSSYIEHDQSFSILRRGL